MLEEQIFVWKWTSIEDYDEEASVDGIEKVKYGKFYALLWPTSTNHWFEDQLPNMQRIEMK